MSKFEREIEELLDQLEEFVPDATPLARVRQPVANKLHRFYRAIQARWRGIPLGHLALTGVSLLIAAYALRGTVPVMSRVLLLASLAVLLMALLALVRGVQALPDITWHGRPLLPEPHRRRLRTLIRLWLGKQSINR